MKKDLKIQGNIKKASRVIFAEYYLEGYSKIFASHFGRGSSLGRNKYLKMWMKVFYKIPAISPMLLISNGKRERKKWIKICQRIVKNMT